MMTQKDQDIIDTLVSLPHEILQFSIDLTDALERHVDEAALRIRESLASATWLPPSARPSPPPQRVPVASNFPPLQPKGFFLWVKDLVSEHRAASAAAVAFASTGALIYWKRRREYVRKRRAKRAANGQKCEVVVVAGTVDTSFPKSLVQDLERRGFIVYVVVSDAADEESVRAQSKPDIIPLHLDVSNPHDLQTSIARFADTLRNNKPSTPRAHPLRLAGLIIAPLNPTSPYPPSPLETTDIAHLSDALNTRVIGPAATLQAFLPLVTAHKARILLLTPGPAASALRLPFHGIEAAAAAAMDALVATVATETRPFDVSVVRFRLGSFEYGHAGADGRQLQVRHPAAVAMQSWPPAARAAYGEVFKVWMGDAGSGNSSATPRSKGSPLRELNNAVFDALTRSGNPGGIWRVGRGSWIYEAVGRLAPSGSIPWLVGLRGAPRTFCI